jgi:hypothetical protein
VIKYLGRYTHRVAISDFRIKSISSNEASFSYHDNKDGGKQKIKTLSYHEVKKNFAALNAADTLFTTMKLILIR